MSLLGALRALVARLVGGSEDGEGDDGDVRCPVCGTDLDSGAEACPLCGSTDLAPRNDGATGDAGRASSTAAESAAATDDAVSRLRELRDDG